ncbi:MAG: ABC-F family ATP-binding cassette domain-containing protein [Bdellovibrionales bacterium]|nr:ABC-F family ATP-binding cassette domain-containing protein [Bdellovibrionales bacterium]
MSQLQIKNLTHAIGNKVLLDKAFLNIEEGSRIGLVGPNGTGKTTFLNLLFERPHLYKSEMVYKKHLVIGYTQQFLSPKYFGKTIEQWADEKNHEFLQYLFELGFEQDSLVKKVEELSGGWASRFQLAHVLSEHPDLILMDEPTNNMDIESIILLEEFLIKNRKTSFIVVSHDRKFLDAVTSQTCFLRHGQLELIHHPFSRAQEILFHRDEDLRIQNEKLNKKIEKLESSATQLAQWGRQFDNEKFSTRAKSMLKRADNMRESFQIEKDLSPLKVSMESSSLRAPFPIRILSAKISIPGSDSFLYSIESLQIKKGEKVAFWGPNGIGKSLFLKDIVENGIDKGTVNPQVKVGYFSQWLDHFPLHVSMREYLLEQTDLSELDATRHLVQCGFPYEKQTQKIEQLSGGERARLCLLVLKLQKPNFLVLDEPTNHLDFQGIEDLVEILAEEQLTVLFVSHDRDFLEKVASHYLFVDEGLLKKSTAWPGLSSHGMNALAIPDSNMKQGESSEDRLIKEIEKLEQRLKVERGLPRKKQSAQRQERWTKELDDLYTSLESASCDHAL